MDETHIIQLSNADLVEIKEALGLFSARKLHLNQISSSTVPFPGVLGRKLTATRSILAKEESGYFVLRGIDSFLHSSHELVAIHMAISAHVGLKRGMAGGSGGDCSVLQHITDMMPPENVGGYHAPPNQTRAIPFHSDLGDIISLFCRSRSNEGGTTLLANGSKVYQEIKRIRPDLLETLKESWTFTSGSSLNPSCTRPIIFRHRNRTKINLPTVRIMGTTSRPRSESLPRLTNKQLKAMAVVQAVAAANATRINLLPGDILFFNNLTLLHAREQFTDDPSIGRKRHLLRLILKAHPDDGDCWLLPAELEETWNQVFDHETQDEVVSVQEELFSLAISH